ncbi:hypothetical protein EGM_03922 [Macaca fascicularis]|uniref:Uncharacterized protein n=1 Tax=Macaca fascicularis TaxID=9541 RepID=G7PJI0_MACFA|nr:hypothetical protein EGM_03922 [Macaca fascicularis]
MLMNCTGVHTLQFILSAGQKPPLILVEKAEVSFPCKKFMMRKNNMRKAGAKTRRSRRSLLSPARGTSGGIQCSMKR